jgi:hypothetical protein
VTPRGLKWSVDHYCGAWGKVLQDKTQGIEIVDDHTIRFRFNDPSLDFSIRRATEGDRYPFEAADHGGHQARGLGCADPVGLSGGEPAYLDTTWVLLYLLGKTGGEGEKREAEASA